MNTLIIYDNKGNIYLTMSGTYLVPQGGVQYLEVEIPAGKIITGVNVKVTPNIPVYEDIPKTDIEIANEKIDLMQKALDELLLGGAL